MFETLQNTEYFNITQENKIERLYKIENPFITLARPPGEALAPVPPPWVCPGKLACAEPPRLAELLDSNTSIAVDPLPGVLGTDEWEAVGDWQHGGR